MKNLEVVYIEALFGLCLIFFVLHTFCVFIYIIYDNPYPGLVLSVTFLVIVLVYSYFEGG